MSSAAQLPDPEGLPGSEGLPSEPPTTDGLSTPAGQSAAAVVAGGRVAGGGVAGGGTVGPGDVRNGTRELQRGAAGSDTSGPTEDPAAQPGERPGTVGIPDATVARLPVYLRALYALGERGVSTVASEELATAAGVNSAKLRKDLSYLGSYGIRGVGYDVDYLVYQVSRALGLTQNWPVVIVGAGNLGRALANYGGFATRGFRISAVLDTDQGMVGRRLGSVIVRHVSELEDVVASNGVAIGVIAVPAGAAQGVCDRLVAAGVTSVLNFAPVVLNVPEGVDVRKVDLSIELQILAFHAQRRSAERFGQAAGHAAAEA
jgi:redox-sensing transcriptional repressor